MISLYGSLARAFEKKYGISARNIPIKVRSVSEAMKAMEANFAGFRAMIKRRGLYHISRGDVLETGKPVPEAEVEMAFGETSFHIMPVVAGCGGKGVWQTIAGVVLIVVGVIASAYGYGAVGGPMIKMGFAMVVGGVAQMLASSPGADYGASEKVDERKSYLFNGPTNAVEPGTTIAVAFGKTWVGSAVASGGIVVEDI